MFTRPSDLSDRAVAEAFRRGWGVRVASVEYAPVGFGSHHWSATTDIGRWFLTVDDLDTRLVDRTDTRPAARQRLVAALATAARLRSAGHEFVVAPIAGDGGRLVETIDDRWALAAYPHLDGDGGTFGAFDDPTERLAVVDVLVSLYRAGTEVPARSADYTIPSRDRLLDAIGERLRPWSGGPFAEPTRALVRRHHEPLVRAIDGYDRLVRGVRAADRPPVITHGEPHPGNVMVGPSGPLLIDWDTVLIAPPERDLWRLIDEDPSVRPRYEHAAGRALDDDALRLFGLWWDLCEVSLFVDDLRRPHEDTEDTRTAWQGLERHLDPERWTDLG